MKVVVFIFEFCCYLKDAHFKIFSLNVDVFVSRKKRHVHITFKISISQYESFDELIEFTSNEWQKRKIFFFDYKMIYPRLKSSMRWKFGYSFLRRKKKIMESIALEKLCNKIIDVIYETFTRKYYFIKMSQSKKQKKVHIYLIVRKKRGRKASSSQEYF